MSLREQIDTVLEEIGRDMKLASSSSQNYDSDTFRSQSNADYYYSAWERIDGTGYLAKRVNHSDQSITSATGELPVPTDLTTLIYS